MTYIPCHRSSTSYMSYRPIVLSSYRPSSLIAVAANRIKIMSSGLTSRVVHQRHKPPTSLEREREIIVALPPLRSNVNAARIIRTAGCCGVKRVIVCGTGKIDSRIARDAAESVEVQRPRSLAPVLKKLAEDGYQLVGLEQTSGSQCLHQFSFPRRCVLVIGHERNGIVDDVLKLLDAVIEIPVYGMPYSYNVATATSMALYEYCRQFPRG